MKFNSTMLTATLCCWIGLMNSCDGFKFLESTSNRLWLCWTYCALWFWFIELVFNARNCLSLLWKWTRKHSFLAKDPSQRLAFLLHTIFAIPIAWKQPHLVEDRYKGRLTTFNPVRYQRECRIINPWILPLGPLKYLVLCKQMVALMMSYLFSCCFRLVWN